LSEIYFGKGDAMIRVDMSEFMERHSVAKLIGSPAGYIGYGDENQLTDRVRRNPYSLVLFDEVEKAHPDVLNLMLQMMEDGCLTDASGRSVTFRNTLIVLTSNVDGRASELGKAFSSEFLNRLDDVIPFAPLCRNDVARIAELELAKTLALVKEKGVTVTLSQAFKDEVVKQGYDATYGARPLRRAVAKLLDDELANSFLSQSFAEGDLIHVDLDSDLRVVVTSVKDELEDSESSADSCRDALSSEADEADQLTKATVSRRAVQKTLLQSSDIDTESTAGSETSGQVSTSEAGAPMFPPPLSELLTHEL
jgi:ATP-dependent Clp protease ATP-binding subunit ClpC